MLSIASASGLSCTVRMFSTTMIGSRTEKWGSNEPFIIILCGDRRGVAASRVRRL